MLRNVLLGALLVIALFSRCEPPRPPAPKPPPKPGDRVQIRGTLGEDVDCRLLRCDDGSVYSLNVRLSNYINGTRVCIHGSILEASQCLTLPTIEVQQVRPWSSCPP
jgi:hypothetical protein